MREDVQIFDVHTAAINQIKQIYSFSQEVYPEYCEQRGIVEIGANPEGFHHTNMNDLKV